MFSVADGYLFTILGLEQGFGGIDIGDWAERSRPIIDRVAARPAVQKAQAAEKAA